MKKTIRDILHQSRYMMIFLVFLGIVNGLLNSGLLMFINNTIWHKPLPFLQKYDWLVFTGLIICALICTRTFQSRMIKFTNGLLFKFELDILNRLKYASFQDFEKLGNERVYTAIEDNRVLSHIPEIFMNAFNSAIIILCCLAYLFWISPFGGAIILALMTLLLLFYLARNKLIEAELQKQRSLQNQYYKYLGDLLSGFKELKMSILRNENIYTKFLMQNRIKNKTIAVTNSIKFMDNELIGTYSWYIVLGAIMFLLARIFSFNTANTTGYLITILYLIGPVAVLLTLVPTYTGVMVSMSRLEAFNEAISKIEPKTVDHDPTLLPELEFERIRFEGVTFEYKSEGPDPSFIFGPIDVEITRGQTVFVVGGNGSGKSTFVLLLTGLYRPVSGKIYFNEVPISMEDYAQFSNKMTAIFTNNHLFSLNYDEMDLQQSNEKLMEFIELMDLGNIIRFGDGDNNLGIGYSKGQQKRVALIYALLEDKPLIVLDEWAAEQDPRFRRYFYKEVLDKLKDAGKTIVAITHDDEYYTCADRIIKFNFGKIVSDTLERKEILEAR